MTFSIRGSFIAALLAVLGLPAVVAVQTGNDTAKAGRDWPTVTGGAGNMRYSPLNQISAQNVARLGAAWTSDKLDAAVSSRAMTVVKDGLMFFTAPPFVYALDAKTGKTVWRYGARPAPGAGPRRRCAPHRRPRAKASRSPKAWSSSGCRTRASSRSTRRPASLSGTATSATTRATKDR